MNFDLTLSNKIFKNNLKSYLKIANDSLLLIAEQNELFVTEMQNKTGINDSWLEESAHLNNAAWIHLNAIYISLFSSFEHFLLKVVKKVEGIPGTKIQLKHIGGTAILDKYVMYLFLVGNIDRTDQSKSPWDKIKQFKAVRNLLVHNGGIMQDSIDSPLEKHPNFLFLKSQDVIMAGGLGIIRMRNDKILKAFADITSKLTDEIVTEFQIKFGNN